jgi:hypothetical protein
MSKVEGQGLRVESRGGRLKSPYKYSAYSL